MREFPSISATWIAIALMVKGGAAISAGEIIALPLARDTGLFELDPDFNLGTQRDLPAGALGDMGDRRRCRILFQVDLTPLPEGEVMAARYRVEVTMEPQSGRRASTFALHRILVPWSEGRQRGDLPGGQPAEEGETTWAARAHPDLGWSLPGGALGVDYAADPSATAEVSRTGEVVFAFNAKGRADLESMRDDPASNHGWVLLSQSEDEPKTARRFASREHRTTPPLLEIEITSPAKDSMLSIRREGDRLVIVAEGTGLRLESSPDLEDGSWEVEADAGTEVNGGVQFEKFLNEPARFYRILTGNASP